MGWPFLLTTLLIFSPGTFAWFTLIQPESASASLGDPVQLSCTIHGGIIFGEFGWLQQERGKSPRYLLYHKIEAKETDFGPEVSGNFSPSANAAKTVAYLTITNVQAKDEATYYCHGYSSSNGYVFGGGTYLNVLGQSPVPPKVHLFPPSQQEIESKNKATLACLVDEFYPKTIEVNWQADGKAISSGVQTSPSTKQGEKYMATSYLILSKSEWDSHEMYACRVTHDGKTFEQVVKKSDCP